MDSEQRFDRSFQVSRPQRPDIVRSPQLVDLAKNTLLILRDGKYISPSGRHVDFATELHDAVTQTRLISAEEGMALLEARPNPQENFLIPQVTRETTLEAAQRLVTEEMQTDLLILSFASANRPGGGFLNGASAQEESLAGSSGLYPALMTQPGFFKRKSGLNSSQGIYIPDLPFIRDSEGNLLENPYLASVVSMAAPNRGSVPSRSKRKIDPTIRNRAGIILALAEKYNHRSLLLGAWGCGAFRNDPVIVADAFGSWLEGPRFQGSFDQVTFAIHDTEPEQKTLQTFERRFGHQ